MTFLKTNYLIILLFFGVGFSSCSKGKNNHDPFYFKATINGQQLTWNAQEHNNYSDGTYGAVNYEDVVALLGADCIANKCYDVRMGTDVHNLITNSPAIKNLIRVYFVEGVNQWWGSYDPMLPWFEKGVKVFGKDRIYNTEPPSNGIIIVYYDANGTVWRSDGGPQQASSFESIDFKDESPQIFYKKLWKARFNCTLYNSGQSITVSNAEIYGPVYYKQ